MSDDSPQDTDRPDDLVTVVYTGTRMPTVDDPRLRIHHLPMLEGVPVDFDQKRVEILVRQPCTLIFYSQNSARIVAESGVLDNIDLTEHTVWAVGEKTAEAVHDQLGLDADVPQDERFEGLVDALLAQPPALPVVAFSLADSPRQLSSRLGWDNVHEIAVYKTCPRLHPRLAAELDEIGADWVAFTSPRGVRTFLSQADNADLSQFKHAAIGPTTAEAMHEAHIAPDLVMDTPDKNLMMRQIVSF